MVKFRKELAEVKFDVRVGKEKDYAQIGWKKKEIARILTVLEGKGSDEANHSEERKRSEESVQVKKVSREGKKGTQGQKKGKVHKSNINTNYEKGKRARQGLE